MSEILIYNAKILTPEGIKSWMLLRDDLIIETGDGEKQYNGEKVDVNNHLIIPGLIDSHLHNYSLGRFSQRL
ncbi:MAG: hypothetical protein OEY49_16180, partial [Candidatus Heimdallarchaeota archaeon]|nr:hypothetical protein [Candidatus Heimdallarchaeota archaeon]